MDIYHFPKAVALVVFNRLDCVKMQIDILKKVTPPRLYIISDGPRKGKDGEEKVVANVRRFIEENVDWNCKLIKIYADENMGCDARSISGYRQVFEREEEAVLLEDDSIPCVDFYKYMEKMLDYYRDTSEVMMVAGFNVAYDYEEKQRKDYFFFIFSTEMCLGNVEKDMDAIRRLENKI